MTEARHPDDMMSIGEALTAGGYKPKPESEWPVRDGAYWAARVDEHWQMQKPKIWVSMEAAGVPLRYIEELRKSGFTHETPALMAVERWRKSGSLMLVLTGANQVGKSYACAYGLSLGTKVIRSKFGDEPWLDYQYMDTDLAWIRASEFGGLRDKFDQEIRLRLRRLENSSMLVVDELGGAKWDDVSKPIEDLLGKRWAANRRTMITTNLRTDGALQAELGERIVERIRRNGLVVEVGGMGEVAA